MTNPQQQNTAVVTSGAPASVAGMSLASMNAPVNVGITSVDDAFRIAALFLRSGLLSKAINSPEKAFTIILAGSELGLKPFESLRHVQIVEGKPSLAADAQLALFKRAGGRANWNRLDATCAELRLIHPNGDSVVETFTHEMAAAAGLLHKDNWKKYKTAMLRSRVITAALKSIGFMPTAGVYDPDEAEAFAPNTMRPELAAVAEQRAQIDPTERVVDGDARLAQAEAGEVSGSDANPTSANASDTQHEATSATSSTSDSNTTEISRNAPTDDESVALFPYAPFKGKKVNARNADDTDYLIDFDMLAKAAAWCAGKRDEYAAKGDAEKSRAFSDRMDGIEAEMERRSIQDTDTSINGVGDSPEGDNG